MAIVILIQDPVQHYNLHRKVSQSDRNKGRAKLGRSSLVVEAHWAVDNSLAFSNETELIYHPRGNLEAAMPLKSFGAESTKGWPLPSVLDITKGQSIVCLCCF